MSEPVDLSDPKAVEAHFLAALPRIERHACVQFSTLTTEAKDDAIQKVRGLAWKYYRSEAQKGKNPDEYISAIAAFAVKHVRDGRDVTGMEKARDVLSRRAQKYKKFTVQSFPEHDVSGGENESLDALRNWRETLPDDAAAFHHDFPMLVDNLSAKQAAVTLDAAMGDTTTELAEKHQVSAARVSQIRREARNKWAELCMPPDERENSR